MSGTSAFNGFPKETIDFFTQLKGNNNKVWFDEHKRDYDTYVMSPSREFVVAMGERLEKLSPDIHADPRVNKSIFRIYRDIRFSKDKTPYKSHLAMWWWEGNGPRMDCSGYYFHLEPPSLTLGIGIYMFPKHVMQTYRDSVVDPVYGAALKDALNEVSKQDKYSLGGKHYKRVPHGYDPEHENVELLLYNGIHVGYETSIPDSCYSSDLVEYCFLAYQDFYPIHEWLVEMTGRA